MALTQTAPTPTPTDVDLDEITHLVCSCRLGPGNKPLEIPVEALCGWKLDEDSPRMGRHLCSMCLEQAAGHGCRHCQEER